jgi:hypothetical protein
MPSVSGYGHCASGNSRSWPALKMETRLEQQSVVREALHGTTVPFLFRKMPGVPGMVLLFVL